MEAFAAFSEAGRAPVPLDHIANQFVAFRCGDASYGVPIMAVREIRSWQPTTSIPRREGASRGVLDIRGTVVEVFDLGELLGYTPIKTTSGSVVLVLALADRVVGILVDAVSDIIQASAADLMGVPASRDGLQWPATVTAMVQNDGQLMGILQIDSLFQ